MAKEKELKTEPLENNSGKTPTNSVRTLMLLNKGQT